jgi:SHS2 domain-containing protein
MTDLRRVRPRESHEVRAEARDPAGLAAAFLNELLVLHSDEAFVARSIAVRVRGSPPTSVVATVTGERFDPARHPSRTEVKAVTLHRLIFDVAGGRARAIVDI